MDISVVMVELIYRIENCEESGGSCSVMYRDLSMFQVLFVACLEKKSTVCCFTNWNVNRMPWVLRKLQVYEFFNK
jgi:hypothetical protein